MNYRNPELIDRLAGEYVLGTLVGAARRRFERLMSESFEVRSAVWRWEQRLGAMGNVVAEEAPPPRVWARINGEITAARGPRPRHAERTAGGTGFWSSLAFWRGWGLVATTAAVVLGITMNLQTPPAPVPAAPDQVAMFADDPTQPLWLISADVATGQLKARAVNATAAEVDQAFELWMLPTGGEPRSLGLLPVNGEVTERTLPPGLQALLIQSEGLAVSIEPAGGSPTGLPTGPVVYQAPMVPL